MIVRHPCEKEEFPLWYTREPAYNVNPVIVYESGQTQTGLPSHETSPAMISSTDSSKRASFIWIPPPREAVTALYTVIIYPK